MNQNEQVVKKIDWVFTETRILHGLHIERLTFNEHGDIDYVEFRNDKANHKVTSNAAQIRAEVESLNGLNTSSTHIIKVARTDAGEKE